MLGIVRGFPLACVSLFGHGFYYLTFLLRAPNHFGEIFYKAARNG